MKVRRLKTRTLYYYSVGTRKPVPLGSDLNEAKRKWAILESGEKLDHDPTSRIAINAKRRMDGMKFVDVYRSAKLRARAKGMPFELSLVDLNALVARADGRCEVSGIPFDARASKFRCRPFAPSLDRIDCKLGYTAANCRIVCTIVNVAMNDWGLEPLIYVAKNITAHQKIKAREIIRNGRT